MQHKKHTSYKYKYNVTISPVSISFQISIGGKIKRTLSIVQIYFKGIRFTEKHYQISDLRNQN